MKHLPVLIIGAGPTGLMIACELARYEIPFRIIDKKKEPTKHSNATWIQSRTLEIFDVVGIVDSFIRIGHACEAINFFLEGKFLASIPLSQMDSSYPFILMLPQHKTERLLNKKLEDAKIYVERSIELINIQQTNHGVISTVQLGDGNTENITSDWVIACDGANSTVREKCQIIFSGEDLPEQFIVADAKMNSFLPTNEIHVFFNTGTLFPDKGTIFSAFPWGSKDYRLSANICQDSPRQSFNEHEVKEIVAERTYGNYIVESVSWISPFWIHGKIVNSMRNGSIFFAGDAAHIHSPAGGQGMNTGIQDAFNLAWKLALVIKDKSNQSLLDSYHEERYPVVKDIITWADHLTNMVLFDKSFVGKLGKFCHKIADDPHLSKDISEKLTQINIRYKSSSIIYHKEDSNLNSPRPGERAPNVQIDDSRTLYSFLDNTHTNILIFAENRILMDNLSKIKELENLLDEKFYEYAKMFIITSETSSIIPNIIPDTTAAVQQRYKIEKAATYIIRPDNYISYYSEEIDPSSIVNFLKRSLSI